MSFQMETSTVVFGPTPRYHETQAGSGRVSHTHTLTCTLILNTGCKVPFKKEKKSDALFESAEQSGMCNYVFDDRLSCLELRKVIVANLWVGSGNFCWWRDSGCSSVCGQGCLILLFMIWWYASSLIGRQPGQSTYSLCLRLRPHCRTFRSLTYAFGGLLEPIPGINRRGRGTLD